MTMARFYRVCVYAICKNEAKFARRWMQSMSEADDIIVLDTGSDDSTPELLRELGAVVHSEIISPWRFDAARNRSLSYVPEDADICVCTDLDEVFHEGWREKVEAAWSEGVGRLRYRYTWNFNPDGSEGCVFWIDKIHARHGFEWIHPVHEVLRYSGEMPCITASAEGVQLDHHADDSKPRSQYLPLLEMSVEESPDDDRNMHYLGREYMFHGQWRKCIDTLTHHLQMPSATWADERCASMRFIARSHEQLGEPDAAERWYYRAIAEAPHLREPWLELARLEYRRERWYSLVAMVERALQVTERPRTYINDSDSWGALPYDLASLGYYYTGDRKRALEYVKKALELSPDDSRLLENFRIINASISKNNGV
ncbi:MAG: tetratricopeptide repeat protein [Clostridia bacterium]|nr:tetratricopeptide repeat protein [Clostridia bacterium]